MVLIYTASVKSTINHENESSLIILKSMARYNICERLVNDLLYLSHWYHLIFFEPSCNS